MAAVYSFLLYHYRWIIFIALFPFLNLLRRYIFISWGTISVIHTKEGTMVVRGKAGRREVINKYGRDGLFSGIASLVIILSSLIVPYFHTMKSVYFEISMVTAGLLIFLISVILTERYRLKLMRMVRGADLEKLLKMLEQQKNNSVKK